MQEDSANPAMEGEIESSLYNRTIKSGFWVLVSRAAQLVVSTIRVIVLARLLLPDDIGLLGAALLTLSILNKFTMPGFVSALIQKKDDIKDYLNSAWSLGVFRSIVLFAVLYFAAPYVGSFLDNPQLVPIIRVIGLTLFLGAFGNIGVVYFTKELQFRKKLIYQNAGTLTDATVTIVLAYFYRSVWALVWGKLAGDFVRMALGYIMHPYRPRFAFEAAKLAELWSYGRHILGSTILNFFVLEGDDLFIAKVLGAHALGLYRYAYRISNMMATEVGDVISTVTFPAYSKLQDNLDKLKGGYIKAVQVVTVLCYPIAGGIAIVGRDFTEVVLGAKWLDMVSAMQVLCLMGAAKCLQGGNVFKSLGRPDIPVRIALVRLIVMVVTIYPLTVKFGLVGSAWSVVISIIAIVPIQLYYVNKMIAHKPGEFLRLISLPLLSTLAMMGVVYLTGNLFPEAGLISLAVQVFAGVVSYVVSTCVLSLFYKEYDLKMLSKDIFSGLTGR